MAASTVSRAPSFGHYLLPLTMNKRHIEAKQAEYHIEVKTRYLDLKKHRPERHALRNLLGMLHFRLDRFDESLKFFDKILSDGEDPENLNALANRKYICEHLYRIPESRECEEKITKLLPDNNQVEGEKNRLRRARSLAEQAFAYSFDVFDESVTTERYRASVKLYDEAFELAGKSLTKDEEEDWMISKGIACHKIFSKVKWDKSKRQETQIWLKEMINIFIKIVEKTDDNSLASESWRQLGEIFQQAKSLYFIPVPNHFKGYKANPLNCFEKALLYTPNDPRILARFAYFFKKIRNKEEALKTVNQSIKIDPTVFNSFAFSVRGQIFLHDYNNQLTACTKRNGSNQPDDSLLKKAQNDFEKASEIHSTPMDLEELALVYYYTATDCNGNVKPGHDGKEYLQKALTMCSRAAACQDGEKRPLVHKTRGQSLCAFGEHQQALKNFQRALECKEYTYVVFEAGNLLVVEYGHVLKDMGDTLSSHQPLLADMVYWLHKAAKLRLSNPQWTPYSLTPLTNLTSQWQSFVRFCEDNDHIWELEDIQQACLKPRQRCSQPRRTVSTLDAESLSHPDEASRARFENFNPHARIGSAPASMSVLELDDNETSSEAKEETSTMIRTTAVSPDDYHPQFKVEFTSASLSALELGGDETSSDEKQITLTVNLKTGKIQLIDQTSSSQKWTSDDSSNKPIRSAPSVALNCDFTYDFFVIYSISASDWVFRCLLEELEGRGLKGCIKDRDFMIGQTKVANYADSIDNSACIVIVVTKDFGEDDWCDRGMLMAFEEAKLLIPLLREGTKLPRFLNTLTHLDATGAVDWTRVQKCIEQQIRLDAAA